MKSEYQNKSANLSRRTFIKTSASAALSLAAVSIKTGKLFAAGSDTLRVGLIGCGGRGTGAVKDCIRSSEGIELAAMGDLFADRLQGSLASLKAEVGANVKVTEETCFVGWDAYQKVIASDVDIVFLTTSPHFRPLHLQAAVAAGKHVFMEKPVAVDPVGVRSVIASSELAQQKDLAILAGTQRRHQNHYIEVMKRVHGGDIGDIVGGQCYFVIHDKPWLGGFVKERQPGWSDMEYQCRCWYWYTWLCGDCIVEQHVHNLDIMNWAIGAHPVKCLGIGGREVRKGPEYGNIYDHFAVEFEYPGGVRILSMCRQTDGCSNRIAERVVGTQGAANTDEAAGSIEGQVPFKYAGPTPNPYEQEHADLIASIRAGEPLNHGRRIAESTLTAIMGRMSAYTGKELKWDWVLKASQLDLTPPRYEMMDLPVEPVAIPGVTPLI